MDRSDHCGPGRSEVEIAYQTPYGVMLLGDSSVLLSSEFVTAYKGKVQLIFTSPPFPLNRKKRYGNLQGNEYKSWLAGFARQFETLLASDGSIVIEVGNAWEPGLPVMSTLAIEALLEFRDAGDFELCQQFVAHNTARLPSPAQWVTVERIRVTDAFTYLWWFSATPRPKAQNRRVLRPYSSSMQQLLKTRRYNSGKRPSEHVINPTSFLRDNGGSIPSNVLTLSHTRANDEYQQYCRENDLRLHSARMPREIAEFFIKFLTEPDDIVLDPFAGSNMTGAAAEGLRRKWLSIELDREYAAGSVGRFPSTQLFLETTERH